MSTDLAVRPDQPTGLAERSNGSTTTNLAAWVEQARSAHTLAIALCKTSFVPKHFRDKPDETAAAILTGAEMGMSPLAAVRAIFIINGTPGMYAKAMVAVVMSHGHMVWIAEQSDDRVVVRGRRKGFAEVYETVWDRARVVKAKLTSNVKYQESSQQMMTARGQAEISRQVAPDALFGIPYAVEELEDPTFVTVGAPTTRVTVAEILGVEEDSTPVAAPVSPAPPARKQTPQQRRMFALLRERGYQDRETGLVLIAGIVGREARSTSELSPGEVDLVVEHLETLPILNPEVEEEA